MLIYPDSTSEPSPARALDDALAAERLLRLTAAGWFLLVGVTWPLWLGTAELPKIPLLTPFLWMPRGVDAGLLIVMASFMTAAVTVPGVVLRRWWVMPTAAGMWLLILAADQLRLQPWAYQFLWILALFCVTARGEVLRGWRWLVVSIYVWSAVSKVDLGFLDGHGQMLLEGLLNLVGKSSRFWFPHQQRIGAAMMPVAELLVAGLLLFPRTRRAGWVASCVLHGLLILVLGPLGLGHERGVLIWNAFFIAQNTLLFAGGGRQASSRGSVALSAYAVAVMTLPALETVGLLDHWPGWAVYCSRPEQVRLYVAPASIERLPQTLRRFALPPDPLAPDHAVNYDAWIFSEVHCPAYPQGRYRLALARAVLANAGIGDDGFRIVTSSTPDRWTGLRQSRELTTLAEADEVLGGFLLNTAARVDEQ